MTFYIILSLNLLWIKCLFKTLVKIQMGCVLGGAI